MKHILVYIDGVLQSPDDYQVISNGMIMFKQAPPKGAQVQIASGHITGSARYITHFADGSRIVFSTPEQTEFNDLIDDLHKYRDHPSVRDQIERLQVILALVKE